MKKGMLYIFIFMLLFGIASEDTFALSNGRIIPGRQTISYNVQGYKKIKSLNIEYEYGISQTLAGEVKFLKGENSNYLDLFLKFKLHEDSTLDISGRLGLQSDFLTATETEKLLGVTFTKNNSSFLKWNGGAEYSLDSKDLGYFIGIDYSLTNNSTFQAGWQDFASRDLRGWVIGLRTEL
mgnify:FL=1